MIRLNKIRTLIISGVFTAFFSTAAHAASYTVVSGDTLYSLGNIFNTSSQSLMNTNGLGSSSIYAGQTLNVPGSYYTVVSGDTLYSIANKFGITLGTLRKINNKWDNMIYVGQRLLVPTGSTSSSTTTTTSSSPAVIPYTASDLNLLARLVRAEAENQSYSAKVAVAATVINRVQSGQFPTTLSSVIYQTINGYYQFSPVLNGSINNTPDQDSINAAYAALHGSDPTNGALFYFDDSSTNTWLWSKTVAYKSGNMVFVY